MKPTTHDVSEMIVASKQSQSIKSVPSQFVHILDGLNKMVADLQQRVEKLESGKDGGTF